MHMAQLSVSPEILPLVTYFSRHLAFLAVEIKKSFILKHLIIRLFVLVEVAVATLQNVHYTVVYDNTLHQVTNITTMD